MVRARKHLQIVDGQYKAPSSAETTQDIDPRLFSNYVVYAVADYLAVPGRMVFNFDCKQILGGEPGLCEFVITNQGWADFPYDNLWIRYALKDGMTPILAEIRLNRRPGHVTPYFDPDQNRLPVGETFGWIEIRENDGLEVSTATDAQPYDKIPEDMQNTEASARIYEEHAESGEPDIYAADMPAAVESAVRYWETNGLTETSRALSAIMRFEGAGTYEQYIEQGY